MVAGILKFAGTGLLILLILGCATARPKIPVEKGSVDPGASVSRGGGAFSAARLPNLHRQTITLREFGGFPDHERC